MAFTISRSQSAFTERQKESMDHIAEECARATVGNGISSELHLKSSSSSKAASSQSLDKHVVLRRIKQRKSYNKAKTAIKALLGTSETHDTTNTTAQQHKWLQHGWKQNQGHNQNYSSKGATQLPCKSMSNGISLALYKLQ